MHVSVLAESEVRELEMSLAVDEYVVGLQVPVDEPEFVDGLHGLHELGDVEASLVLREGVPFDEQGHKVSCGEILHNEIEVLVVLEGALHFHDPVVPFGLL